MLKTIAQKLIVPIKTLLNRAEKLEKVQPLNPTSLK